MISLLAVGVLGLVAATAPQHVTLQPIPWPAGIYAGTYERALSERVSVAVGVSADALWLTTSDGGKTTALSLLGGGLQPGVNYYLRGRAPAGLWVGAKLELSYLALVTETRTADDATFASATTGFLYGGHVMIGYTHVTSFGLTLQLGLGLGASGTTLSTRSFDGTTASPFVVAGTLGRASLAAGWSF